MEMPPRARVESVTFLIVFRVEHGLSEATMRPFFCRVVSCRVSCRAMDRNRSTVEKQV